MLSGGVWEGSTEAPWRLAADADSAVCLIGYVSALLDALAHPNSQPTPLSQNYDSDASDPGASLPRDQPLVDSADADSPDEHNIDDKLCTFTVTQKEFMNQHWYAVFWY